MPKNVERLPAAKTYPPAGAGDELIRPEILEVLREGRLGVASAQRRQNYRDIFDRLLDRFGQSPKMAIVSWCIASNLARLIGDREPTGWRWAPVIYGDPDLEKAVKDYEAFERRFFAMARNFLPVAVEMRDSLPFHEPAMDDLVKALEPFARPRKRAADPRSEWHSTAHFFAERIEAHFQSANLTPPTRNSVCGSLVLAVQSLLEMVGRRAEAEAIRKTLCQP